MLPAPLQTSPVMVHSPLRRLKSTSAGFFLVERQSWSFRLKMKSFTFGSMVWKRYRPASELKLPRIRLLLTGTDFQGEKPHTQSGFGNDGSSSQSMRRAGLDSEGRKKIFTLFSIIGHLPTESRRDRLTRPSSQAPRYLLEPGTQYEDQEQGGLLMSGACLPPSLYLWVSRVCFKTFWFGREKVGYR